MTKVYIAPQFRKEDKGDGGIRRVVEAQMKYLPQFGVEPVHNVAQADVIANHGEMMVEWANLPMVAHNHGLYWARYEWGANYLEINERVTEVMRRAVAHTAPSEWVATALRRGMLIYPEVVYHGVDPDFFVPDEELGDYVLWNKARSDLVSNHEDMQTVAALMPKRNFVSTVGDSTNNVWIPGVMNYQFMKKYVCRASVYLATARETFGIGTLEALSAGVPVAGWNWGGQKEIIIPGETGYLAEPGDYEGLAEAIEKCYEERERLSQNARQDVLDRWRWEDKIEQYANLYHRLSKQHKKKRPKVSVVVTCHNLGEYLGDTLRSVWGQTFDDWECIIVDDASEDDSPEIAKEWAKDDKRFKYCRTPKNLKLSLARNFGFTKAKGRYIMWLDADDMIEKNTLLLLSEALDQDTSIHISYGHLDLMNEAGEIKRNKWPPNEFSWLQQMAHQNQQPYAWMCRREVMERSGGFRERHWRAEDAALMCRLTSFGFRPKKITQASTLLYRDRSDSKSKGEPGDGDWTSWYPWRVPDASTGPEGAKALRAGRRPDYNVVPFGSVGKPPKDWYAWRVNDYANPATSVIIPCGPGHEKLVVNAVESVMAQTYPNWEIIVVNDTGKKWPEGFKSPLAGLPYVRLVENEGNKGVAYSRNLGASHARGETLLFLDADDLLLPEFLERTLTLYKGTGGIVYTGWYRSDSDGSDLVEFKPNDFKCAGVLNRMRHSVTVIIPRIEHEKIGGFDEEVAGWEDWDYFIALEANGVCAYKVDAPLFVYSFRQGQRREMSDANRDSLIKYIRIKWKDYYPREDGRTEKKIMCGGCAKKKKATIRQIQAKESASTEAGMVKLVYQGPHLGPITYRGQESGQNYRFGQHPSKSVRFVYSEDATHLLQMTYRGTSMFVLFDADLPPKEEESIAFMQAKTQEPKVETPEYPDMIIDVDQDKMISQNIGNIPISQLRLMLKTAEVETIETWLEDEVVGQARQTAISLMERRIKRLRRV